MIGSRIVFSQERRKSSPLFRGYTDLLHTIVKAFGHGFGMSRYTYPQNPKNTKDFLEVQIQEPFRTAYKRRQQIKREMLIQEGKEDNKGMEDKVADDSDHRDYKKQDDTTSSTQKQTEDKTKEYNGVDNALKGTTSDTQSSSGSARQKKNIKKLHGKNEYAEINLKKNYLLKRLLLQIVQFLTPKECHALYKINSSPNLGWNKNFISVFNAFLNEIAVKNDGKTEVEDDVVELIDYQHPHRAHVKQHQDVLRLIKKLIPNRKLSLADRDKIMNVYNRRKDQGHFDEDDITDLLGIFTKEKNLKNVGSKDLQDFIMSFLDKKRSQLIEEPISKIILAGKKSKNKAIPLELNFTFENDPQKLQITPNKEVPTTTNREGVTDVYKLFLHKYQKVSDSVKGLRQFLSELGYRPRLSLVAENLLERGKPQPEFSFELLTKKIPTEIPIEQKALGMRKKLKFDGPDDKKLQYCYLDDKYNYNNRFYMYDNVWRDEWVATNIVAGTPNVSAADLSCKRNMDIGVVDVIHLFSKPSELRFVERQNNILTLKPVVRDVEIKIFDENDIYRKFPMNYSYLELCEEEVTDVLKIPSDDSEADLSKSLKRTDKEIKRKIIKTHRKNRPDWNEDERKRKRHTVEPLREQQSLDQAIKSCPHCINAYYEANKERMQMLNFIEVKRDAHIAFCMARPNRSPHPSSVIEEHKKRIQFYEKYIGYLQNDSSVYNSYGKKIASDDCRQFKYFLELLNYKVIYDYFPVNVLFRKFQYETRPWAIYPEEFEFTESRLFEQTVLNNEVRPRILKQQFNNKPSMDIIGVPSFSKFPEKNYASKGIPKGKVQLGNIKVVKESSKETQPVTTATGEVGVVASTHDVIKSNKKPLYPEVDVNDVTQMELFRNLRPKRRHTKPHKTYKQVERKRGTSQIASSTINKKIWK